MQRILAACFVFLFATFELISAEPQGKEWIGQRIIPRHFNVEFKVGTRVVARTSDVKFGPHVTDVNGKWLQIITPNGPAWVDRAHVLTLAEAEAFFTAQIHADPTDANGYARRGNARFARGEYRRAIDDYTAALRLRPDRPLVLNNRGNAWIELGEYEIAIRDFDAWLKIDPDDAGAYNNRGNAWKAIGQFDKVLADCNEAIRRDSRYSMAHNNRAWLRATCLDAEYWDGKKAIADATTACEFASWKEYLYLGTLAAAYARAEDFESAVKWQKKALELVAKDSRERPDMLGRLTLYENDRAYIDFKLGIKPDAADFYHARGVQWFRQNNYDKAVEDFNEAIRIGPDSARLYTERGVIWLKMQRYEKALADFEEAIRKDDQLPVVYNNRAWLRAACPDQEFRDGEAAVRDAKKACELSEWKVSQYLGTLAAAYAESGDFDAALEWDEKAFELLPPERRNRVQFEARKDLYRQRMPLREGSAAVP